HAFSSGAGRTSDGNGSHASTLKSPSYTKSVSWQHYPKDARRFVITAPGDYPAGTTTLEPENAWQKWNGSKWEDDAESMRVALTREAELEKIRLLKQAHTAIATLQDAVVLGMASQEETLLLTAWKKYRVLLNRIQVEDAPEIVWPEVPGNVA
ncbi:tail fiber assembly protein, partial [Escherichia coli]